MAIGTPATNEIFDPRTWQEWPAHEYRIYADDRAQIFAIVDEEDYPLSLQHKWGWKRSKGGKLYVRRNVQVGPRRTRIQRSEYLHIVIAKRMGLVPPDDDHSIVDHRNGLSLDCTRRNLRYATPSMNSLNAIRK